MDKDFFSETSDDDFFGVNNDLGTPQQQNAPVQVNQGGAPPIPPPPSSLEQNMMNNGMNGLNGTAQIQGSMDNPNVMVGVAGAPGTLNADDFPENNSMTNIADKLGIKKTEIRTPTIPEEDTLNESLGKTFKRDCSGIGKRSLAVILPCLFIKKNIMKDTDIFGPLIIMLVMGIFTSIGFENRNAIGLDISNNPSTYYVAIVLIVLVGTLLCGVNMKVLGGSIGISQTFTLIGYSLLPMAVASIVLAFIKNKWAVIIVEIIVCVWGIIVSVFFMNKMIRGKKKPLALYPIILIFIGLTAFECWTFGGLVVGPTIIIVGEKDVMEYLFTPIEKLAAYAHP